MICQSTWLFQYIFWGIAFPFVISLYIWLIVFDLSCLVNAVNRFSKVIQLFLAYAAGMLWSENTTSVEELEENIKVYCNSLQGFLLLTYGSMVGAGPTLSTCIRKSANQVSDCSLSLLRKAVSYYGTLSDSLSAQTSLLPNNRAAKWSFSLCTSYLKCWHPQLQSCFFIVLILLFFLMIVLWIGPARLFYRHIMHGLLHCLCIFLHSFKFFFFKVFSLFLKTAAFEIEIPS